MFPLLPTRKGAIPTASEGAPGGVSSHPEAGTGRGWSSGPGPRSRRGGARSGAAGVRPPPRQGRRGGAGKRPGRNSAVPGPRTGERCGDPRGPRPPTPQVSPWRPGASREGKDHRSSHTRDPRRATHEGRRRGRAAVATVSRPPQRPPNPEPRLPGWLRHPPVFVNKPVTWRRPSDPPAPREPSGSPRQTSPAGPAARSARAPRTSGRGSQGADRC